MRHRKGFNHLGRTSSHRKAMLSNMANSLLLHKRITTTKACCQLPKPILPKNDVYGNQKKTKRPPRKKPQKKLKFLLKPLLKLPQQKKLLPDPLVHMTKTKAILSGWLLF